MKFLKILILILTLNIHAVDPNDIFIPKFKNDLDKTAYIIGLQELFPSMISDLMEYRMNFFELLENADELTKFLSKNPKYIEAFEERKYIELSVKILKQVEAISSEISDESLDKWKQDIIDDFNSFVQTDDNIRSSLIEKITELSKYLGNKRSDEFLKIIIQILPEDIRNDINAQTNISEKIRYIENNFSNIVLKEEKIPNKYGKLIQGNSLGDAIKSLNDLIEKEEALNTSLRLYITLKEYLDDSKSKIIDTIKLFDKYKFYYLGDIQDVVGPILEELGLSENNIKRHKSLFNRYLKLYSKDQSQTIDRLSGSILIREATPAQSLFRSCVGGDCATQTAWQSSSDPGKRYFYVLDENGNMKGYIQTWEIEVDGKNMLYISTINGPKISKTMTKVILESFYRNIDKLGVNGIVIPKDLSGRFNYPVITEVFEEKQQGKKLIIITHTHVEIKEQIEKYDKNINSVDLLKNNEKGFSYTPDSSLTLETEVKNVEIKPINGVINNKSVFELLIVMRYSNRKDELEKIIEATKIITREEFENIFQSIKNESKLSIKYYLQKLEDIINRLELGKDYFKQNPLLHYPGFIRSIDAFNDQHIEETVKYIVYLLDNDKESDLIKKLLEDQFNSKQFKSSQAGIDYLDKLLKMLNDNDIVKKGLDKLKNIKIYNDEILLKIAQLIETGNWIIKESASNLLYPLKQLPRDVEKILKKLLDSDDDTVKNILESLKNKHLSDETLLKIAKIIETGNSHTKSLAFYLLSLLKELPRDVQNILEKLLDSDYIDTVQYALILLKNKHLSDGSLLKIAKIIETEDWNIKSFASDLLSPLKELPRDVQDILEKLLDSGDEDVYKYTIHSLNGKKKLKKSSIIKIINLIDVYEPVFSNFFKNLDINSYPILLELFFISSKFDHDELTFLSNEEKTLLKNFGKIKFSDEQLEIFESSSKHLNLLFSDDKDTRLKVALSLDKFPMISKIYKQTNPEEFKLANKISNIISILSCSIKK